MKQIVKLIDVDVDGCGTNVETMIQVEGKQELTNGIIQRTKDVIEKYKKGCDGEYDTDSVVDTVCEYLENEGYMCDHISEDVTIEF
jgi:dTDP-D-glucose 4,6-dehydratase